MKLVFFVIATLALAGCAYDVGFQTPIGGAHYGVNVAPGLVPHQPLPPYPY
jgi:hypothetical protein